jgi:CRP-like cAMP-binding protein
MGEAAILRKSLRTASIVALSPLELIHLSADSLVRLSEEMPRFHEALEKVAAERLRSS